MTTAALLLFAILPSPDVTTDRVDVLEVNHFYDDNGQHVFDQVIFWDQHVAGWMLLDKLGGHRPRYDHERREWVLAWVDQGDGIDGDGMQVLRDVRSPVFRESFTQVDPEAVDRAEFCKERRRGLGRVKPREKSVLRR